MANGGHLENWRNRNFSTIIEPVSMNLAVLLDISLLDPYGL